MIGLSDSQQEAFDIVSMKLRLHLIVKLLERLLRKEFSTCTAVQHDSKTLSGTELVFDDWIKVMAFCLFVVRPPYNKPLTKPQTLF
jgi:hypothetical protein